MVAIDLLLPTDARSPWAARHSIDALAGELPDEVVERFRLAVTELVTNAVVHGEDAGEVGVRIRVSRGVVRVDVIDPGAQLADGLSPCEGDAEKESGRGLMLVDRATDRWGFTHVDGPRTWFEIDIGSQPRQSYGA